MAGDRFGHRANGARRSRSGPQGIDAAYRQDSLALSATGMLMGNVPGNVSRPSTVRPCVISVKRVTARGRQEYTSGDSAHATDGALLFRILEVGPPPRGKL